MSGNVKYEVTNSLGFQKHLPEGMGEGKGEDQLGKL